jgi:hypothetical protein
MDQHQRRRGTRMTCAFGYLTASPVDGVLERRESGSTEGSHLASAEGQHHAMPSIPASVGMDTAGPRRPAPLAAVSVTHKRVRRVPVDVE